MKTQRYFTLTGYETGGRNLLHDDFHNLLKAHTQQIIESPEAFTTFRKELEDAVHRLNGWHPRCKPLEPRWRNLGAGITPDFSENNTRGWAFTAGCGLELFVYPEFGG